MSDAAPALPLTDEELASEQRVHAAAEQERLEDYEIYGDPRHQTVGGHAHYARGRLLATIDALKAKLFRTDKAYLTALTREACKDDALKEWIERAERAEAQAQELREALKPFAAAFGRISGGTPDYYKPSFEFTTGDFRRAASALESKHSREN